MPIPGLVSGPFRMTMGRISMLPAFVIDAEPTGTLVLLPGTLNHA